MDLIRRIVLAIEEQPAGTGKRFTLSERVAGADRDELLAHIGLAQEAGLIEVKLRRALGREWGVYEAELTNLGHDFAESLRSKEQMARAFDWIKKAGRDVTLHLLIEWVMRQMGE
ncbi:MAG: DUF2513 domain-containing protein [Acidobacteria bacterium]|nr:DUF2513 domain-containing protein [Acidobacteriota bacterium]